MTIPLPSSQRTLGSMLTFARSMSGAEKQSNSKRIPAFAGMTIRVWN